MDSISTAQLAQGDFLVNQQWVFERKTIPDLRTSLVDGRVWMRIIESRNKTTHTHNETMARDIAVDVRSGFFPAFCELERTLLKRLSV